MQAYIINLTIYQCYDTPGYDTSTDLTVIPELGKPVILNRRKNDVGDSVPHGGKPPLISEEGDQGDVLPSSSKSTMASVRPEHPTRVQPYRRNKEYIVYYAMDSESSSDEPTTDKMHPDEEYIPPSLKGTQLLGMFPLNI